MFRMGEAVEKTHVSIYFFSGLDFISLVAWKEGTNLEKN